MRKTYFNLSHYKSDVITRIVLNFEVIMATCYYQLQKLFQEPTIGQHG